MVLLQRASYQMKQTMDPKYFYVFLIVSAIAVVNEAAPPSVTSTPSPTLHSNMPADTVVDVLAVTDPDGDPFTCDLNPALSVPFSVYMAVHPDGYLMIFRQSDPTTLTASSYLVDLNCTDDQGDYTSVDITVTISSNSPPGPTSTVNEIVPVDVSVKYLPLTVLHTVGATDPDGDTITCTATPPTGFSVDSDCKIRNTVDLRSLTLSEEVINIQVSDGINTAVAFKTTLSFTKTNSAPVFAALPSDVSKREDVAPGEVIVTFDVTDAQAVSRTISVDKDAALFDSDLSTGEVVLAAGQSFDYDAGTRKMVITCVASDGFKQTTASVTVSVLDVNEAPVLSPPALAITLDEGPATSVSETLAITLTDEDGTSGNSHTYSMLSGGTFSTYFNFPDPNKPILSNLLELDRETPLPALSFTLDIVATDTGRKTATAKVTVTLNDVNDNAPVFQSASLVLQSVYVGMQAGTHLGTIQATDQDEGTNQEIEFSLVTPNAHPGLFEVQTNGKVSLLKELTESYGTSLSLEVKATDKGVPQMSSTTVVTPDWNQPPAITNLPENADVPEGPLTEKQLLVLATSDPESDLVSCQVTSVSPVSGSGLFVVRSVSASQEAVYFTADQKLDSSATQFYDVTVTAFDGKGGQSSGVLRVEVKPNTRPQSSCDGANSATVDVKYAAINNEVTALTVTDVEGDDLTFTVTSQPNSGSFVFDRGTRRVLVARDLRKESVASHEMTIEISDSNSVPVTCTLYITLTNINEPPLFAPHTAVQPVDEHVTSLTSLFGFDVTDIDSISVTWSVDPLGETGMLSFDDANREIFLASGQSFDYETGRRQFIVTCTADDGFLTSSASVTLTIRDTNDQPYFVLDPVQVTVLEGPAPTITISPDYGVMDPDGDSLTFALVAGGTYNHVLTINSTSGQLTNLLDLEHDEGATSPITVKVSAADPSGLSATVDVKIFIDDVNDNAPTFDKTGYEFMVSLSTQKGETLGTMKVTDKDSGTNAEFDLTVVSETPSSYIKVEQDGDVILSRDLDVDYGTPFFLEVEAKDRGTPPLSSTAVLTIVWNSGPKFLNLPATAYINESVEVKTVIFDLSVTDVEMDKYTCVKHSILPTTTAFDVEDLGQKVIKVVYTASNKLSVEDTARYDMTIRCFDGNGETINELAIVVRPNKPPVLDCDPQQTVSVTAMDKAKDDVVHTVKATDDDSDILIFSMTSPLFYIGAYSGVIQASDSLRKATVDQYALSVLVSDGKHTVDCTLIISLTDRNKAPRFPQVSYRVEVPEDTAGGSNLVTIDVDDTTLFTTDLDVTLNSGHKNLFEQDVSGTAVSIRLKSGQTLDYESGTTSYTMTLQASDGYLQSEEVTVTIEVTPVNEPPYFEKNILTYHTTFKEISDPPEINALGCKAIDPDQGDKVTLTLSGTNAGLFTIADLDNCQMTLTSEFDIDERASSPATLTLKATDDHGLSTQATVIVTIEAINDNTPAFEGPVALNLTYGMDIGDVIGEVVATDVDVGTHGDVSYSVSTWPDSEAEAKKYITFLSTGEFKVRESMDDVVTTGRNFQYIIKAEDYGIPPKTATTTVNVVYDPTVTTTTPLPSTSNTTTTPAPVVDESLLSEPLFIGLLVGLLVLAAILAGILIYFCCKYCGANKQSENLHPKYKKESDNRSRSPPTPVRTNKISVVSMENGYKTPMSGTGMTTERKISSLLPLPPPHY